MQYIWKCERLHLGWKHPIQQYRLGTHWVNSILQKRTWVASWARSFSLQCAIDSNSGQQHPGLYEQEM